MQDTHISLYGLGNQRDISVFGVFDGHGGSGAAIYTAANLAAKIVQTQCWDDNRVSGTHPIITCI